MGFVDALFPYQSVGIDTAVFIYHLENHPTYISLTQQLFSRVEAGGMNGWTSTITLMEIAVRPYQVNKEDIARKYEALLASFPNLHIVDINRDIARRAAQLRAEFRFRPPDALQIAACLVHQVPAFVTNDRRLGIVRKLMDVIILDDWI